MPMEPLDILKSALWIAGIAWAVTGIIKGRATQNNQQNNIKKSKRDTLIDILLETESAKIEQLDRQRVIEDLSKVGLFDKTNALEFWIITAKADEITRRHSQALSRKRIQLISIDEYGIVQDRKWRREIKYFIEKVVIPEIESWASNEKRHHFHDSLEYKRIINNEHEENEILNTLVDEYATNTNKYIDQAPLDLTPIEYEHYVADVFSRSGWKTQLTSATGDHGADVIAQKGKTRVAVQCKKYSTPVGNSAVQQAYSAKDFYGCTHAAVVTNSTFTAAAKTAARKLDVALLHDTELDRYMKEIGSIKPTM